MLDITLKDLKRHKARTFLTVLGVVIAIGAIVSLGSISSGMNELVNNQVALMGGLMTLQESDTASMQAGPPSGQVLVSDIEEIREISGVENVAGMILKQSGSTMIAGVDLENMELMQLENIQLLDGNWPESGEYKAVVGYYLYENNNLDTGDTFLIEEEEIEINGIMEETSGMMDYAILTSLETAQELFEQEEYVTWAFLKPYNLEDADKLEDEIEDAYPSIDVTTSAENLESAEDTISQIRIITLGIGAVSAIVAAIGIINTMFMSVSQRKRQIGIMKAVGATQKQVIYDVMEEGIAISVLGGFFGILIGLIGTAGLNQMMGMPLAKVTPGLALGSFAFGVILTLAASLYPAITASKIDPVEAIRGAA